MKHIVKYIYIFIFCSNFVVSVPSDQDGYRQRAYNTNYWPVVETSARRYQNLNARPQENNPGNDNIPYELNPTSGQQQNVQNNRNTRRSDDVRLHNQSNLLPQNEESRTQIFQNNVAEQRSGSAGRVQPRIVKHEIIASHPTPRNDQGYINDYSNDAQINSDNLLPNRYRYGTLSPTNFASPGENTPTNEYNSQVIRLRPNQQVVLDIEDTDLGENKIKKLEQEKQSYVPTLQKNQVKPRTNNLNQAIGALNIDQRFNDESRTFRNSEGPLIEKDTSNYGKIIYAHNEPLRVEYEKPVSEENDKTDITRVLKIFNLGRKLTTLEAEDIAKTNKHIKNYEYVKPVNDHYERSKYIAPLNIEYHEPLTDEQNTPQESERLLVTNYFNPLSTLQVNNVDADYDASMNIDNRKPKTEYTIPTKKSKRRFNTSNSNILVHKNTPGNQLEQIDAMNLGLENKKILTRPRSSQNNQKYTFNTVSLDKLRKEQLFSPEVKLFNTSNTFLDKSSTYQLNDEDNSDINNIPIVYSAESSDNNPTYIENQKLYTITNNVQAGNPSKVIEPVVYISFSDINNKRKTLLKPVRNKFDITNSREENANTFIAQPEYLDDQNVQTVLGQAKHIFLINSNSGRNIDSDFTNFDSHRSDQLSADIVTDLPAQNKVITAVSQGLDLEQILTKLNMQNNQKSFKRRYLVVHPNGTVERVDEIEPIIAKSPKYIFMKSRNIITGQDGNDLKKENVNYQNNGPSLASVKDMTYDNNSDDVEMNSDDKPIYKWTGDQESVVTHEQTQQSKTKISNSRYQKVPVRHKKEDYISTSSLKTGLVGNDNSEKTNANNTSGSLLDLIFGSKSESHGLDHSPHNKPVSSSNHKNISENVEDISNIFFPDIQTETKNSSHNISNNSNNQQHVFYNAADDYTAFIEPIGDAETTNDENFGKSVQDVLIQTHNGFSGTNHHPHKKHAKHVPLLNSESLEKTNADDTSQDYSSQDSKDLVDHKKNPYTSDIFESNDQPGEEKDDTPGIYLHNTFIGTQSDSQRSVYSNDDSNFKEFPRTPSDDQDKINSDNTFGRSLFLFGNSRDSQESNDFVNEKQTFSLSDVFPSNPDTFGFNLESEKSLDDTSGTGTLIEPQSNLQIYSDDNSYGKEASEIISGSNNDHHKSNSDDTSGTSLLDVIFGITNDSQDNNNSVVQKQMTSLSDVAPSNSIVFESNEKSENSKDDTSGTEFYDTQIGMQSDLKKTISSTENSNTKDVLETTPGSNDGQYKANTAETSFFDTVFGNSRHSDESYDTKIYKSHHTQSKGDKFSDTNDKLYVTSVDKELSASNSHSNAETNNTNMDNIKGNVHDTFKETKIDPDSNASDQRLVLSNNEGASISDSASNTISNSRGGLSSLFSRLFDWFSSSQTSGDGGATAENKGSHNKKGLRHETSSLNSNDYNSESYSENAEIITWSPIEKPQDTSNSDSPVVVNKPISIHKSNPNHLKHSRSRHRSVGASSQSDSYITQGSAQLHNQVVPANSHSNQVIDLSQFTKEGRPIEWFRGNGDGSSDHIAEKKGSDIIHVLEFDYNPMVTRDTKTTIYPNGTILQEFTETVYKDKEDTEPTVIKTTKVTHPDKLN